MKVRIKMSEVVHYQFDIEVDDDAGASAINEAAERLFVENGPQKEWIVGSSNRDLDDWEPLSDPAQGPSV